MRGLITQACLLSGLVCLSPLVAAQDTSISAENGPPPWLTANLMQLALNTAPLATGFTVAPLTIGAGLNQTKPSPKEGTIEFADQTNYTTVDLDQKIVYLSCDSNDNSSLISTNDIFLSISNKVPAPAAIMLFSLVDDYCFLGGSDPPFDYIWTTTNATDAQQIQSYIQGSTSLDAQIQATDSGVPSGGGIGGTSTVAMSILYSITGLITILFLIIIATGAVRAHRHPERYGPRTGTNGRPRQSRARGIARAMLETLPIVKFGENADPKPDEEHGGENGVRSQELQNTPAVVVSDESGAPTQPRNSSEVTRDPTTGQEADGAKGDSSTTLPAAKKDPESESNDLGCSICTEDFTRGEDVRVLPCNHKFHPACVDPWLVNVSGTCPLCRLDLRPPEVIAAEAARNAARANAIASANASNGTTASEGDANPEANAEAPNTHLAPPTVEGESEGGETDAQHRRRRSRLLDWNRLRHASVDERIQALRAYRQAQQGSNGDDERRHSRLTARFRERFHIRTSSQNTTQSAETSNQSTPAPAPAPAPSSGPE